MTTKSQHPLTLHSTELTMHRCQKRCQHPHCPKAGSKSSPLVRLDHSDADAASTPTRRLCSMNTASWRLAADIGGGWSVRNVSTMRLRAKRTRARERERERRGENEKGRKRCATVSDTSESWTLQWQKSLSLSFNEWLQPHLNHKFRAVIVTTVAKRIRRFQFARRDFDAN